MSNVKDLTDKMISEDQDAYLDRILQVLLTIALFWPTILQSLGGSSESLKNSNILSWSLMIAAIVTSYAISIIAGKELRKWIFSTVKWLILLNLFLYVAVFVTISASAGVDIMPGSIVIIFGTSLLLIMFAPFIVLFFLCMNLVIRLFDFIDLGINRFVSYFFTETMCGKWISSRFKKTTSHE